MSSNLPGTEDREERGAACMEEREAWLPEEIKEARLYGLKII